MTTAIQIKEISKLNAAGIMHTGVQGIENSFEKLITWANSKKLLDNPEATMGRLFYDSFKTTAPDKVRMHIFIATKESFEEDREIEKITIPSVRCITGRFEIKPDEFEKSWTELFIWMKENGYQKAAQHPFELYYNDFRKHPERTCVVDLCIPVEY